ncbi:MAG TPA: FAD-binding protein [Anaerohalosphaeraceae bacterium]|nr:FAD-binding protein [Anaerohalosphaeraceae bacterium]
MSDYIVLVKQVPDVSQITDNAFDPNTGNLIRTRLPSVINELDAQALAFARRMAFLAGDQKARIIALTMGPPMAAEVLRYCLARCADTAILLTDKALGGADTWATANPLAWAIRKIAKEMLQDPQDYYIVAGMQSVDGDTAQVPPQIAEELNIPCVSYITDAQFQQGQFAFTRIISGGSQTVQLRRMPAVLTVAKYEYPLFASFQRTRQAAKTPLIQWDARTIQAKAIGVEGSKTRVIRVFPPGKTSRKCQPVHSAKELAQIIAQSLRQASADEQAQQEKGRPAYLLPARRKSPFDRSFEGTAKELADFQVLTQILEEMKITRLEGITEQVCEKILQDPRVDFHKKALEDMLEGYRQTEPTYKGEVWVVAEQDENGIHPAVFELLGKARELADSLEVQTGVVLAGKSVRALADSLIAAGADKVYLLEHPLLEPFDPFVWRKAVADVWEKYRPQIVLFAATPQGRVLAPMVSYRTGCGLTADCTGLDIRDSSRKKQIAILFQTRPALGGNVMATICTKDSPCQMATARPGVMQRLKDNPSRKGIIIPHPPALTAEDLSLEILRTEKGTGKVHFDSDCIVSGGKGMQNRDNYDRLLNTLCTAIRERFGVSVEKGASRTAVEQGFAERIYQVGQTGTAVGPKLYIAVGISGAIQHMIGIANTETIVAINTDPHAPIFKQCDYYLIGSAEQVIPQLAEELRTMG